MPKGDSMKVKVAPNKGTGMKLKPKGFTIDPNAATQVIQTGMSQQDALKMAADQIVKVPYEMGVLVATDGTVFVRSDFDTGSTHQPWVEVRAAGFKTKDVVSLHNHPGIGGKGRTLGGPPSSADWNVMVSRGQSSSYITSKEGWYELKITNSNPFEVGKFFTTYDSYGKSKSSNYTKNAKKAYNTPKYDATTDGYLKAHFHTLQKFGPKYGFEIHFTPNPGYEHIYD